MAAVAALTLMLAVAPSPAPNDVAPEPALKEIGHVRATTAFCRALLGEAADAVSAETANDMKFTAVLGALTTLDFDSNQLAKSNSVAELTRRFVELRASAVTGNAAMARFKSEAGRAEDEPRRAALISFADALDGALHRQKMLADDLGRFIAYLDAHDPIDKETHDRMEFDALYSQNVAGSHGDPLDVVPPRLSTVASDAATELADRARAVTGDENVAAKRIDEAFAGC